MTTTMRRIIPTLLMAAMTLLTTGTAAQTKWSKSAAKTTFTLKTFAPNGNLIGSATGFYIGANGEAVSNFAPFRKASRAIVIDANGNEQQVECIIGANSIYDVAKFKVSAAKTAAVTAATAKSQDGNIVWMMPYAAKKVPAMVMGTVNKVETADNTHTYYTFQMQVPENAGGCPLFNDNGEAIGIMQQPAGDLSNGYAVSLSMAIDLKASPLIFSDPTLSETMIKKALPDDVKDATVTLFTAQSLADSLTKASIIEDFIAKFPNSPEGYKYRAQASINARRFADADNDMQQAIKASADNDDAYFTYARMIYNHNITEQAENLYAPWTLERAEQAINSANAHNPQPVYSSLKAQIKFAQKQYANAFDIYKQLIDGGNATADNYYGAAMCRGQQGDNIAMLALLDSTVATFSEPYVREAAPYILARAEARMAQGKMREAVQDLNNYERLMPQVNDRFYYIRFDAERQCRLFQQALNDIRQAISKNDRNPLYYSEKASLEIRVKLYADAIATAQELIALAPDSSDGYLFLGLAQCLSGNKPEGRKNLEKAKQMGDTQAQALIEKYGA